MSSYLSSGAIFSDDRHYRYQLWRQWEKYAKAFVVIGFDPSTADEYEDDATIRRCVAFARREGRGRLTMLNLFAFRATDPRDLFAATDPIGEANDHHLGQAAVHPTTQYVVAAWGSIDRDGSRAAAVKAYYSRLWCFGRNRDGSPKHPLYLKADTPLVEFSLRSDDLAAEARRRAYQHAAGMVPALSEQGRKDG